MSEQEKYIAIAEASRVFGSIILMAICYTLLLFGLKEGGKGDQ